MKRRLGTLVQITLAALLFIYAVDWAVWHLRIRRGTAFGSVPVEHYLSTTLKGNKAEFDYLGTATQACSNSIFPQAGDLPCWWLKRHKTEWQQ